MGEDIVEYSKPITIDTIERINPEWIISFNYKYIIKQDIIDHMQGHIINLHTSLLPWNRGANPNFWSFFDKTPKGVTIHLISKELDRGDILFQKECIFNASEETFASTYQKLMEEIVTLFVNKWNAIKSGHFVPKKQKGEGSYHSAKELMLLREKFEFSWDDNIEETMQAYRKILAK